MSSNAAARKRAEKAARRKKQLAERRKVEMAGSRARDRARMRRLGMAPIYQCLLQKQSLADEGVGILIFARKPAAGTVALSSFMLDSYCLGVKNAYFIERDLAEADWIIDSMIETAPAIPVEPGYARKLLHELVAWSRSLGIEPHEDYAEAEALFGDVSTEGQVIEFPFGLEGKPVLVPGPEDTPAQLRRWSERLTLAVGADGFEWAEVDEDAAPVEDELDEPVEPFDDAEFEARAGLYDPAREPDPKAWLALDEEERLMRIEAYHRLAEIPQTDGAFHALFHMAVENQIALGDEVPVQRTVARLMAEGLDRHQAIHAVASKIAERMHRARESGDDKLVSSEAYFAAVETLTAEACAGRWRRMKTGHQAASRHRCSAATLSSRRPAQDRSWMHTSGYFLDREPASSVRQPMLNLAVIPRIQP